MAFPTETVYGLGANALDAVAVERIFQAKGRPAESPIIVHVDSIEMARGLVREWPQEAEKLARRFWPGPLTLVVKKDARIPNIVTAGLDTVGLRMPAHPVALELVKLAGVPIAAPSANRFSELSPTTAQHVRAGLGAKVDVILDGGASPVGIESTVLSLVGGVHRLLRPGMVNQHEIEALIGPVEGGEQPQAGEGHASPGLHARHYRPRTPLILVDADQPLRQGRGAYLYRTAVGPLRDGLKAVAMPADARAYAAVLYETLHRLDTEGLDWIAVERVPDGPEWAAVADRLARAAR